MKTSYLDKLVRNVTTIITHDGKMHADDLISAWAIKKYYYKDVKRVSRKEIELMSTDNTVLAIDCGGGEFDHHQKDAERREDGVLFSTLGLLWKAGLNETFYENIYIDLVDANDAKSSLAKDIARRTMQMFSEEIVDMIDYIDNGKERPESQFSWLIPAVSISNFVPYTPDQMILGLMDGVVEQMVQICKGIIITQQAILRNDNDDFIVLNEGTSWMKPVIEYNWTPNVLKKFVIFKRHDGDWTVQSVPKDFNTFATHEAIPAEWLEETTKPTGIKFCHHARFLATFDSEINAIAAVRSRKGGNE